MTDRDPRSGWPMRRVMQLAVVVAVLAALLPAGNARASLQPAAEFTGPFGYSADGLGTFSGVGTLQATVPPGSTVVRAFLYQTTYEVFSGEPTQSQLTVTFDGSSVFTAPLDHSDRGGAGAITARADVTTRVAAKVRLGGTFDFSVGYDHTNGNGLALVVVYSNPDLPRRRIVVLDGGASPFGQSTTVDLGVQVDPRLPGFDAEMVLGIGHSTHFTDGHVCADAQGQVTAVNLNGRRISSCAGNRDDGAARDGALITVGGVGDELDNPADPFTRNSGTDDERYDIAPFLEPGDDRLRIDTENPSRDDSLFLGVVSVEVEADSDGDRVPDRIDNCSGTVNPDQQDLDGDGLGDVCDPDLDGDTVNNENDNCIDVSNADQADQDDDGQGDVCDLDRDGDGVPNDGDNCPAVANPDQADLDGDGLGNACDLDRDGDGVLNTGDNCPDAANPSQADIDGDGLGDVCDPDRDGDGVANASDNCADVPNEDQADQDGDGLGDVCDADLDGDTVRNDLDNCARVANQDQANIDGDALGDVCDADRDGDGVDNSTDNCADHANAGQSDLDGDALGDVCDADLDGDGVANATDNCPAVSNADQADADGDGLGDACDPLQDRDKDGVADASDNCLDTPNPDRHDTDQDGQGDACDPVTPPDRDRDGVPDTPDNCDDDPNPGQRDADGDDVGDACDPLPPGDAAVVAGTTAAVRLVSGDVFVKLPRRSAAAARLKGELARSAQSAPIRGFVPLKGIATVPVGSTVDARKGRLALTTAANFRRPGAPGQRTQAGTFSAALFQIKQARKRRRPRVRVATTDLVLRTPPGAARACASGRTPIGLSPVKGVVRSLTGSAKGRFRTVAGASITTVTNGIWITSDRCRGTLTEVGRGRAEVFDRGRRRMVTVRPGQAYLARARLFGAKLDRSKRSRPQSGRPDGAARRPTVPRRRPVRSPRSARPGLCLAICLVPDAPFDVLEQVFHAPHGEQLRDAGHTARSLVGLSDRHPRSWRGPRADVDRL